MADSSVSEEIYRSHLHKGAFADRCQIHTAQRWKPWALDQQRNPALVSHSAAARCCVPDVVHKGAVAK
jgi:hypothetical protein